MSNAVSREKEHRPPGRLSLADYGVASPGRIFRYAGVVAPGIQLKAKPSDVKK
ncbi:MAG: hypothetical protein PHH44_06660 [bacterium]|jgi:hypothetical protein|nr:hypothetical protein [bacterium]